MDIQQTKDYLSGIRNLDMQLKTKIAELKRLRQDICSLQAIDYSKDVVTGGDTMDLADEIAKLNALSEQIKKECQELIKSKANARAVILRIPDTLQQAVLIYRYINCVDWDVIADKLHYSFSKIMKIHSASIKSFQLYSKMQQENAGV